MHLMPPQPARITRYIWQHHTCITGKATRYAVNVPGWEQPALKP